MNEDDVKSPYFWSAPPYTVSEERGRTTVSYWFVAAFFAEMEEIRHATDIEVRTLGGSAFLHHAHPDSTTFALVVTVPGAREASVCAIRESVRRALGSLRSFWQEFAAQVSSH